MSLALRSLVLYLEPSTPAPPASGYAPMDVIWLLSLLLCVFGSLPLDMLMLAVHATY